MRIKGGSDLEDFLREKNVGIGIRDRCRIINDQRLMVRIYSYLLPDIFTS